MSYQEGRCFFCANLEGKGHADVCPIGLPTKHHFKMIWWDAWLAGYMSKPMPRQEDPKDFATAQLGWVQGVNYG